LWWVHVPKADLVEDLCGSGGSLFATLSFSMKQMKRISPFHLSAGAGQGLEQMGASSFPDQVRDKLQFSG
jgi:hypothetical protein